MVSFDATTAYREEWRYIDGVEDGTLIQRKLNGEEIASYPVKLLREQLSPLSVKYLWHNPPSWTPEPPRPAMGNAIILEELDDANNPVELVIATVDSQHPTGPYEITCTEPPRNE